MSVTPKVELVVKPEQYQSETTV